MFNHLRVGLLIWTQVPIIAQVFHYFSRWRPNLKATYSGGNSLANYLKKPSSSSGKPLVFPFNSGHHYWFL